MHHVQRKAVRPTRIVRPASLDDAIAVLQRLGDSARLVAGATDLQLEIERGARRGIHTLVDLYAVPGLNRIETDGDEVVLGPLVTHNDVIASSLLVDVARPLAQACLEVGSPQLRNRATVVGNLVTASPANDTISALMALDARLVIRRAGGERIVDLVDFYPGFRETVLRPGELVAEIRIPRLDPPGRGVFVKLGLRRAQAISVVHLAVVVRIEDAVVTDARLALGSVAPTVVVVDAVREALVGTPLDDAAVERAAEAAEAASHPIDDLRAPADYRADTVGVMVRRALRHLRSGDDTWAARPPLLRIPTTPSADLPPPDAEIADDQPVVIRVNGEARSGPRAASLTLLDWLRGQDGLLGTKEGCAEGECGACTVRLDGQAVMSCLVPAAQAVGGEVVTVEGLASDGRLAPVQQAFIDQAAVQCGFCIPGFLVSGSVLLDEIDDPSTEQIRAGYAGNLCRCTGYYRIIDAVRQASGAPPDEPSSATGPSSNTGRSA